MDVVNFLLLHAVKHLCEEDTIAMRFHYPHFENLGYNMCRCPGICTWPCMMAMGSIVVAQYRLVALPLGCQALHLFAVVCTAGQDLHGALL